MAHQHLVENPMSISSTAPGQPEEHDARVFAPAEPEATFQSPYGEAARRRRRLGGMSAASLLLSLAAVIAVAGVAFAVGRTTAGGTGSIPAANTSAGNGALPGGVTAPGYGFGDDQGRPTGDDANRLDQARGLSGTVISVSGNILTLQLADGRTVGVTLGSSTTYHSQVAASAADVTSGSKVTVSVSGIGPGSDDSGSVTATDVTITGS